MTALIGKAKAVSEEYNSALADLTFNSKPMINVLTMLAEENNDHGQVIVQVICDRIKKVGVDQKMPSLYLLDSILKNIGGDYVPIISRYIVDVFCHTFEAAIDERKRMQLFKLRNTWTQYIPAKNLYDLDVRINRTDPNWPVIAQTNTPKEGALPPGPSPKVHINPKFLAKTDANNPLGTSIAVTIAAAIGAEDAAVLRKQRLLEEEKRVQEQLKLLQAQKLKREREQHELALKRQQVEREKLLAEQRRQLELLRKQQQTMTDKNKNPSSVNAESSSKVKSELQEESNSKDPRKIESSGAKDPRLIRNIEKQADSQKLGKSVTQLKSGGKSAVSVVNKIMTNMNVKKTKPSFVTQKSPPGRRHPHSFSDIHERKLNKSPVFPKKEEGANNIQNMSGNISTKNTQVSNSNHLTRIMNSMEQTFLPEPTVDSKLPNTQSRPSVQTRIVTELTKPLDENIEVNPEKTDTSKQTESQQMKNLPNSILANPEAKHQHPAVHQASENKPRPPVLSKACAPQVTTVPRPRPTVPQMTSLVPTIEEVKIAQAVALARTGPPPVPPRQISPAFPQLSNLNSVDMQIAAQAAAIATAIHQLQSVNQTVNQLQSTNLIQNSTQPQPVNQTTINPQQSAELAAKLIQLVSSQPALLSQPNEPEPPPPGVSPDTVKASLVENKKRSPTPPAKEGLLQRDKQEGRRAELKERRRDNAVRDAREIAKERRELREKEAMRQAEVRDREGMKKEYSEINSREREIRVHDRNKMRDVRPERSRDRSPYRSRNERDSRPRSGSPGYNRTRTEDRLTSERQIKERIDRGHPEHKDEPPLKKMKESDDVQERSRKARARSPSRYWFRMERKIETEKRVEEKEKELHLQRARKDSGGETTEFHKTSSPRGRPYMRKPDDVSSAQWLNYKKDRKKEFRYIKSRLLDIRRDIRDGIPDLNINVLKEHRIEVNQKLKKGDISKEQYDELCQLMDNIENAHRYKINNERESYRLMEGQIPPGGIPYGSRDFHPGHSQGFDGMKRPPLHFRHDERFPPPPHGINDALYQERHARPPFQQQHPNDQRFPRPPLREPFPHPRDGPPAPGPRFENHPPFQPVRERFMGPQLVERPPPGHPHERPLPGHSHERPPPGHLHERPPMGHPHNRPPPGHPHVRPSAGNLHERPPPGHPLEMPPPGHRLERPPLRLPLERPPMEPLRPPFPMDVRDTYQENRFPPPRPFMHEPQHPGPNQFPQQGIRPAPAGYPGVDLRPPFAPVDQQSQPSNMPKIPSGFQSYLPSENFQQQAPDSNSPIDVSALLGKLLAHGIKVEKKETDLNVPAINLNMEELRKRHEGAINQLFQGVQCSSCGHRFPLNAKAQYSEHLDWHFRQNRKEKDGIRKVSSRTWFYDLHDWIEQNQRPVADDGKVQSAFFEAERSTKTDETTDTVVTQSDMKKNKTKDQTIPVFAEDGDGTCEICCEALEQYWDEDAEEWRYRKAVREDGKTYHQACFEDYIPYEYEEESRPQSPSNIVQLSDDKPQVEAHEDLLKTSDDQEAKITENPEEETLDIEVKEEISIDNPKMETLGNAEFKKEDFIENTHLEKSEEVSEISDSSEVKTETPGEADSKLTTYSSEDKTNVTVGDQVDSKLEIANEQTNNDQIGNIKEETCEKEESIVKEELPVNEVKNKSGNEATETVVKDG